MSRSSRRNQAVVYHTYWLLWKPTEVLGERRELIVIDDASTDGTGRWRQRWCRG